MDETIHLGLSKVKPHNKEVTGNEITRNGESFYKITNADGMRPFFMSIVSNSDHWMFISSLGSLSAGRKNSNYALFPYYTDDKITESAEVTGSKSIFIVTVSEKKHIWEPFSERHAQVYDTTRNLYKNIYGNKLIFEEINHDLQLTFSYEWNSSNQFGFIRKSQLVNNGKDAVKVDFIDGIQNISFGPNMHFLNTKIIFYQ